MKLVAFTIVLDGEPFIERHLPVFQQLTIPWRWIIAHGTAQNGGSTGWCTKQKPRLSIDGTTEYLASISCGKDDVTVTASKDWKSKDQMVNACLLPINNPCVLMQIDSDEIWTAEQLETIFDCFDQMRSLESIKFACRYFVGPNLMLEGENSYGDYDREWVRAWRFNPGDTFYSHEPPILRQSFKGQFMTKALSRTLGLIFDHFPYVTEAQVAYKEKFYGYSGLLAQWRALQAHKDFPVPLSRFFAHVSGDLPMVVKI